MSATRCDNSAKRHTVDFVVVAFSLTIVVAFVDVVDFGGGGGGDGER